MESVDSQKKAEEPAERPQPGKNESLRVYVRVRPRMKSEFLKETAAFCEPDVPFPKYSFAVRLGPSRSTTAAESSRECTTASSAHPRRRKIFSPQLKVTLAADPVDSVKTVVEGINATVFAYGQTGSGKTHTMFGPNWEESLRSDMSKPKPSTNINYAEQSEKHGIIPRAVYKLFSETLGENVSVASQEYTIYCSFVQIYNEKLYDLLQDKDSKHPLLIRENKYNGIYVQGLSEFVVTSMEECLTLLFRGERNRIIRQTRLNMFSSRSHTIFKIIVEHAKVDQRGNLRKAKLNMCDLAGSEKIGPEADVTGKHFEELKTINLSLTTLGKVISALAARSPHVPFRDSKLTRLLQDSIGGVTRTCLIATVAPTADCADESISTLSFANRAQKVSVVATTNVISASDDALVKKLQQELQYMKDLLQLKRRGGMGDVNRQLLLLKQENDKLRAMGENLGTVESLKRENKMMRLELQRIKDNGSTFNDNDAGSGTELSSKGTWNASRNQAQVAAGSTPYSRKPVPTLTLTSSVSAAGVGKRVELQRRAEREAAAESLRRTMTKMGRCPICTLPIPCKHYASPADIREDPMRSRSIDPLYAGGPGGNNELTSKSMLGGDLSISSSGNATKSKGLNPTNVYDCVMRAR